MSLGEADAKYPGSHTSDGVGPGPSALNPAGVYPKSDPHAAAQPSRTSSNSPAALGNPFLMNKAFSTLDHSLGEVIQLIESEEAAVGNSEEPSDLLRKFKGWRDDLDSIRSGGQRLPQSRSSSSGRTGMREGGIFSD